MLHGVCRCFIWVPTKFKHHVQITCNVIFSSCQEFALFISVSLARRSILVLPGVHGDFFKTCLGFYVTLHSKIAVTVFFQIYFDEFCHGNISKFKPLHLEQRRDVMEAIHWAAWPLLLIE